MFHSRQLDVQFRAVYLSIRPSFSQCQQSERTFSQCLMCTSRTTSRYCCGDFNTEPRLRPVRVLLSFPLVCPALTYFFQDVPQDASTIPGTASVESVSKSAPPEIAGVCTAAHCQKRPISLADYYFSRTIPVDLAEDSSTVTAHKSVFYFRPTRFPTKQVDVSDSRPTKSMFSENQVHIIASNNDLTLRPARFPTK